MSDNAKSAIPNLEDLLNRQYEILDERDAILFEIEDKAEQIGNLWREVNAMPPAVQRLQVAQAFSDAQQRDSLANRPGSSRISPLLFQAEKIDKELESLRKDERDTILMDYLEKKDALAALIAAHSSAQRELLQVEAELENVKTAIEDTVDSSDEA